MNRTAVSLLSILVLVLAACEQKPATSPAGVTPVNPPAAGAAKPDSDHHGGEIVELGTASIGGLTARAAREAGEIKPGADAVIDVWLTTADGKPATVTAVRLWIGTEDAKGSVKARADIEDPKQPNHWHAHAEAPDPLPTGSKLWVEIERTDGQKSVVSFELKA